MGTSTLSLNEDYKHLEIGGSNVLPRCLQQQEREEVVEVEGAGEGGEGVATQGAEEGPQARPTNLKP